MKEIENIFSKNPVKSTEKQNKIPIIVDTREKQSLVYSHLVGKNANVKFEKLDIGDYLIEDIVIERKTFSDFQSSMIDKRLLSQLSEMKKYDKRLLILEGFLFDYSSSKIHENAIKGMILSCSLDFNVPIIYTENEEDSAKLLLVLARKFEKNTSTLSLRHKKSDMTLVEQKQFILEGFPGIGPTTAKSLIHNFKTLQNIFSAEKKELEKIDTMDSKKIDNFRNIIES